MTASLSDKRSMFALRNAISILRLISSLHSSVAAEMLKIVLSVFLYGLIVIDGTPYI